MSRYGNDEKEDLYYQIENFLEERGSESLSSSIEEIMGVVGDVIRDKVYELEGEK